ncbi:hypothetical protein [Actinomadura luteofluorescens]
MVETVQARQARPVTLKGGRSLMPARYASSHRLLRASAVGALTVAAVSLLPAGGPPGNAATAARLRTLATYQVVTGDPVTVGPGKGQGAFAKCPAGTVVLGGGESNTVLLPTGIELVSSNPDIYDNGWRTSFVNTSTLLNATVRTQAICAGGIPGYRFSYLQDQLIPRGRVRREFNHTCPAGTVTLAGGSDGTQGLRLLDSYPGASNDWVTTVFNTALNSDLHTTLFNVCGTGITRSLEVGEGVSLSKGGRAHASLTCPAGTKVLSGGGENTPRGSNMITDTFPSSDGRTWTVYVKNVIDDNSWMRVRAFCAA